MSSPLCRSPRSGMSTAGRRRLEAPEVPRRLTRPATSGARGRNPSTCGVRASGSLPRATRRPAPVRTAPPRSARYPGSPGTEGGRWSPTTSNCRPGRSGSAGRSPTPTCSCCAGASRPPVGPRLTAGSSVTRRRRPPGYARTPRWSRTPTGTSTTSGGTRCCRRRGLASPAGASDASAPPKLVDTMVRSGAIVLRERRLHAAAEHTPVTAESLRVPFPGAWPVAAPTRARAAEPQWRPPEDRVGGTVRPSM